MYDVGEPRARWLLLIHQLPPSPAYLRVKTARQLQKVGAVAIKNSVYVLPSSDAAFESFTWVARQIAAQHGESSLCESNFVGGSSNEAIEALFNAARGRDYQDLAVELRAAAKSLGKNRRLSDERRASGRAALARLRRRHAEIHALDFFEAPQAESVASLLDDLATRLEEPTTAAARGAYPAAEKIRRGTWVTRQGVHVDRIASAWLIRRFIDAEATFKFVPAKGYRPEPGERRFDMFEAEYTHEGDRCTFEVLTRRFAVDDPAVLALGEVVHDIDVRDGKFARPETPGIERMVNGLALTQPDDDARIAGGSLLFDALYASFKRKRK
ncbi:MAG TPA: chromate resistance protein ChrB domain-containing protein [Polyangia bacterium]|nr:chromate resistance protein ChrB domain-containing protein [Polyangia bacterium]